MAEGLSLHSKLIASAARNILSPTGMFQKGRSRTWLSDHGWWLDVVEFQPSSWTKGTYLNVSCSWLWNVKSYLSFDEGEVRINRLLAFVDEAQFAQAVEELTLRAREQVLYQRSLFPTIDAVSSFYLRETKQPAGWQAFNAAVAHGVCGRSVAAVDMLARFCCDLDPRVRWKKEALDDAVFLASIVNDRNQFCDVIFDRIAQARKLQKLPELPIPLEGWIDKSK